MRKQNTRVALAYPQLRKGFTIIELIVVIVIIAILAALVTVAYRGVQESARDKSLLSDIDSVETEITRYAVKNGGTYDTSLNWDSSGGSNSNIQFLPTSGNVIVVTTSGSDYCIKAYNPQSNNKTLATAVSRGVCGGSAYTARSSLNTCTVKTGGTAYCWGFGGYNQLGNGSTTDTSVPVAVTTSGALSGKTIKSLEMGYYTTCAIASDSNAYCWGIGTSGELGNNTTISSSSPVAVTTSGALAGKTIKAIKGGFSTFCAIASDNNVYCWGQGTQGALGNGSTSNSSVPVAVSIPGESITSLVSMIDSSVGYSSFCALASDGTAYCWGYGTSGQLGNGASVSSSSPVAVVTSGVLSGKVITSLATATGEVCAVASDGSAYCWGLGTSAQLGNGTYISSASPVAVTMSGVLAGKTIQQLVVSNYSAVCVVASDGLPYCWGNGGQGALGNGSSGYSATPAAVTASGVLAGKKVKSISMGYYNTCVLASDNNVYCWGYGGDGELGNGSTSGSLVPVAVTTSGALSGKNLQRLAGGSFTYCAISSDDNTYCWGRGSYGVLGNGSTSSSSVPVQAVFP